jgi:hypothetical protein
MTPQKRVKISLPCQAAVEGCSLEVLPVDSIIHSLVKFRKAHITTRKSPNNFDALVYL